MYFFVLFCFILFLTAQYCGSELNSCCVSSCLERLLLLAAETYEIDSETGSSTLPEFVC